MFAATFFFVLIGRPYEAILMLVKFKKLPQKCVKCFNTSNKTYSKLFRKLVSIGINCKT